MLIFSIYSIATGESNSEQFLLIFFENTSKQNNKISKYEVNICSNILEDAFVERHTTVQASFRREVGFGASRSEGCEGCSDDDSRFIDTVSLSHPVRKARSHQAMCQRYLGDPCMSGD